MLLLLRHLHSTLERADADAAAAAAAAQEAAERGVGASSPALPPPGDSRGSAPVAMEASASASVSQVGESGGGKGD